MGGWLRLLQPWIGALGLTMRWLSAAAGVLLVPLLWVLGRRLWDRPAGLAAALVAASSPLLVYYGQEARMYTLLVLLATTTALAVVGLVEPGTPRRKTEVARRVFVAGLAALWMPCRPGVAVVCVPTAFPG